MLRKIYERKKCNRSRNEERNNAIVVAKEKLYRELAKLAAIDMTETDIELMRILSRDKSVRAEKE